jgi:hypothetical protein
MASTQPAAAARAKITMLSTPQEHAQGKFHWRVEPDRPLVLAIRCDALLDAQQTALGGGGTSLALPDTRPVEIVGEQILKNGYTTLNLSAFHPKPDDTPRLLNSQATYAFGGKTATDIAVAGHIGQLTGQYVSFASCRLLEKGRPVGAAFYGIRVVPFEQRDSALATPMPIDAMRTPLRAPGM